MYNWTNMMDGGNGYAMGGFAIFGIIMWLLVIANLCLLAVFLWQKVKK